MDVIERSFVFDRETKGTRRFAEVEVEGEAPAIGSLYVKKHVLHHLGNPETLTVTVTAS